MPRCPVPCVHGSRILAFVRSSRVRTGLLLCACALGAAPLAYRLGVDTVASIIGTRSYNPIYVETILENWRVYEDVNELVAVAANKNRRNVAMLFKEGSAFRVYKDGVLLLEREVRNPQIPDFFRLTDDGVLIYYLEPDTLYVNGDRVSSTSNTHLYSGGMRLQDLYRRGSVTFVDGRTIRRYEAFNGRSTILHRHPHDIAHARVHGSSVYYTAYDVQPLPGYYLYRNGRKVDYDRVANPRSFAVSGRGDVYVFRESDETCSLHKNGEVYAAAYGRCGFLTLDPAGNVWHVVARNDDTSASGIGAVLYRNGVRVRAPTLHDLETFIGFGPDGSYALRALPSARSDAGYRLLKDGRLTGDPFDFTGVRDALGIQYGPGGRTYMRNLNDGHWVLYEDGIPVNEGGFDQVYQFRATPTGVSVIGTMPRARR